ncbi:SGNH/GDSL hydrolase family protein [uncultured Sphingomonas sp.]|uniref:SGNH/GDSL hydrolase family protein n=1 Tax=uncultured Sphingomonas sp. TaxID=158754 RepID=UPI0035CAB51C
MPGFGLGIASAARRRYRFQMVIADPIVPPVGFVRNGATNPALKAMLARVAGGTGRGRIVFKGDSTSAGAGGSDLAADNTGARPFRPAAALAGQLSTGGIPALDNGFVGDNGMTKEGGCGLPAYDGRVVLANWNVYPDYSFAGGALLGSNSGALTFTATTSVDTFEMVLFNLSSPAVMTVLIDGAAPASIVRSGGMTGSANTLVAGTSGVGFCKAIVTAASAGTHTISLTSNTTDRPILRSIIAYDSAVRAIDMLVHAVNGAKSADQGYTSSPDLFYNNDALGYDAPDLTVINLGLNDGSQGVSASAYSSNLQAIVAKAKLSGDVLLVSPHPASSSFSAFAMQTGLRDAAAALAVANGIAYMDLYSYFVSFAAVQSRLADGFVHPRGEMYAEIGQVYRRCIQAMAA